MRSMRRRIAAAALGTVVAMGALGACDGEVVIPIEAAQVSTDGMTVDLIYNACEVEATATFDESSDTVKVYLLA